MSYPYMPCSWVICAQCAKRLWLPTVTVAVLPTTPFPLVSDEMPVRPPTVYHFCSETCHQAWLDAQTATTEEAEEAE
jgi:hypothetical protein